MKAFASLALGGYSSTEESCAGGRNRRPWDIWIARQHCRRKRVVRQWSRSGFAGREGYRIAFSDLTPGYIRDCRNRSQA
jgi:hypothetical protein